MRHLIMVYGSLKTGFSNNRILTDSKLVGEAETVEAYNMTADHFPYVAKFPQFTTIKGEVWIVDNFTLHNLDILESHPSWYKREKVEVVVKGEKVKAWMYFNEVTKGKEHILDGIFKQNRTGNIRYSDTSVQEKLDSSYR